MTRMIERWFPCSEVSDASISGWGSGNSEGSLFTWFAKRPLAQAKAAVLTSLLPWPEDEADQKRLQDLVCEALQGYAAAHDAVLMELRALYPVREPCVLDPFSGRGMIPVEVARLGCYAAGIDYLPMAVLGSRLLADFPLRDWSREPPLPYAEGPSRLAESRLLADVEVALDEIGRRFTDRMQPFYPRIEGRQPWGYLWAIALPCQECGRRFPLVGNLALRPPNPKKNDRGQSFRLLPDSTTGSIAVEIHDGPPTGTPTRRVAAGKSKYDAAGKVAVCPFCEHTHPKDVHTRLAHEGLGKDMLLLAAELDPGGGKSFRSLTQAEYDAAEAAARDLDEQSPFPNGLAAVPDEAIPPGNTWTVQATVYGAKTYGDMCNRRQTLGFVTLARTIAEVGTELLGVGISTDYAHALCGYGSAVMVRKLRRATRGCTIAVSRQGVTDIFATESSLAFSYDYFEVGLGEGPGTWESVKDSTLTALRRQVSRSPGSPADIQRGTATSLPYRSKSFDAVVTDPPYDAMIDYSDASDLFYVWLKRSMSTTYPELALTTEPHGVQEKTEEIIVKKGGTSTADPRSRKHYDSLIARAFSEARRVVSEDGVVTIVFGHGEPEVWHRLLNAMSASGLILTGSWPAKTEKGGKVGFSNIVTTLTMSCRPAPLNRKPARAAAVEAEVKAEVKARMPLWSRSGLAPTDMLMASAGPAMEVVGRYSEVLNNKGEVLEPDRYLTVARRAVQEAESIEIDHLPLESFDARTRFALWWVRLFKKSVAPKSELRWQVLAADMELPDVRDVVADADKGCRFVAARDFRGTISESSPVIDVALAMARAWPDGLDAVGEVMVASGRDRDDTYLWAAIAFLADRLPDGDPDTVAWTGLLRNRKGVVSAARSVSSIRQQARTEAEARSSQRSLFESERDSEGSA